MLNEIKKMKLAEIETRDESKKEIFIDSTSYFYEENESFFEKIKKKQLNYPNFLKALVIKKNSLDKHF